jgi:hypothetical protein
LENGEIEIQRFCYLTWAAALLWNQERQRQVGQSESSHSLRIICTDDYTCANMTTLANPCVYEINAVIVTAKKIPAH